VGWQKEKLLEELRSLSEIGDLDREIKGLERTLDKLEVEVREDKPHLSLS
jgi:hypothetical protein